MEIKKEWLLTSVVQIKHVSAVSDTCVYTIKWKIVSSDTKQPKFKAGIILLTFYITFFELQNQNKDGRAMIEMDKIWHARDTGVLK